MIQTGQMINDLYKLREEIRDLDKQLRELKGAKKEMEFSLIERLDKEGVSGSKSDLASVTVSERVKPNVHDWPEFYKYIRKNDYFHLMDKRASVTGCRELFETKGAIPGVTPFVDRTLNMRNL